VTPAELARVNAEMQALRDEITAQVIAELAAKGLIVQPEPAPVRHLRPVTSTARSR
jgi:hypothetical protein